MTIQGDNWTIPRKNSSIPFGKRSYVVGNRNALATERQYRNCHDKANHFQYSQLHVFKIKPYTRCYKIVYDKYGGTVKNKQLPLAKSNFAQPSFANSGKALLI